MCQRHLICKFQKPRYLQNEAENIIKIRLEILICMF